MLSAQMLHTLLITVTPTPVHVIFFEKKHVRVLEEIAVKKYPLNQSYNDLYVQYIQYMVHIVNF